MAFWVEKIHLSKSWDILCFWGFFLHRFIARHILHTSVVLN